MINTERLQKRAKLLLDANALINKDDVSAEDMAQFHAMTAEADRLEAIVKEQHASAQRVAALSEIVGERAERTNISRDAAMQSHEDGKVLFSAHLKGLANAPLALAEKRTVKSYQAAAAGTTSTGVGLALVHTLWQDYAYAAIAAAGGMWEIADVIRSDTGGTMNFSTVDDTAAVAYIATQNSAQTSTTDFTWATVAVPVYQYTTGHILASREIMQDAGIDFGKFVLDQATNRFTRGTNAHFTTGTGSGQPSGIATGAAVGITGATGTTTSVILGSIYDFVHSVNPAYRANARFLLNNSSIKALRKLVDGESRPVWQPALIAGQPDTLLGYPVHLNQDVASFSANARSIFFGDFKNYKIRLVNDLSFSVLTELYSGTGQVAFCGLMRCGGALVSGGVPVRWYQNSAT